MKKYNLLMILLLLFATGALSAQEWEQSLNDLRDLTRFYNRDFNNLEVKNSYASIEGSPFLYKDFRKGEVALKNGKLFRGEFRYDKYADQVEFRVKQGIYWVAEPDQIDYIKIDSIHLIYVTKEPEHPDKGSYYEVLVSGKCYLLLKEGVILQSAEQPKPYTDAKPAKFIERKKLYYLLNDQNNPVRINNKKIIPQVLSEKSSEISAFIKKNKLSFKKEKDLIRIVNYYNSL